MQENSWGQFFKDTKEYFSKNISYMLAIFFIFILITPFLSLFFDIYKLYPCYKEKEQIFKLEEKINELEKALEEETEDATDYMTLYCHTINYKTKPCLEWQEVLNKFDKDMTYRKELLKIN